MERLDPNIKAPDIRMPLPGPLAAKLIARDERVTSPSYTRVYPLAVKRAGGCVIEDLDGNRFLDFNAGIAVCATGHCHPQVVNAIEQQAAALLHYSGTDFYYPPQCELAEKLAALAPGDAAKKVFFTNSGAESVEAAIKLARWHTGRSRLVGFFGGFHGRTLGALSITSSKAIQRNRFGPLVPQVHHVEYPNTYRFDGSPQECSDQCLAFIEKNLFARTAPPDEIAAFVVEPIQGEGGYLTPPDDFLPRLHALAKQHGILLIADEVQAGMGRTGKMFACEHYGVTPDIICLAKGIASGMPLGAIVASEEVMNWTPGSHASTYGGNPVACVASLATIELLESGLMQNAIDVGEYLRGKLFVLQTRHASIGDIRGKGLMLGMELVEDRETKHPAAKLRDALVERCFHKGLLLLGCGKNTIRFCPPLVISKEQVDIAIEIIDVCLE